MYGKLCISHFDNNIRTMYLETRSFKTLLFVLVHKFIVYSAPSFASQPINLHRIFLIFGELLSIFVIFIK